MAVFDLENALAFVSYASADGKHKAFTRSPIFLDMGFFFKDF